MEYITLNYHYPILNTIILYFPIGSLIALYGLASAIFIFITTSFG